MITRRLAAPHTEAVLALARLAQGVTGLALVERVVAIAARIPTWAPRPIMRPFLGLEKGGLVRVEVRLGPRVGPRVGARVGLRVGLRVGVGVGLRVWVGVGWGWA